MRQDVVPQTKEHLLGLWLSRCQTQKVRMVTQDPKSQGNWNRQDQISQDCLQGLQESNQRKKLIIYPFEILNYHQDSSMQAQEKIYKNYSLPFRPHPGKTGDLECEGIKGDEKELVAAELQVQAEQWPSGNRLGIGMMKQIFAKPTHITALTYNVWFQENNTHNRYPALLKIINEANADFVCLQQVCSKFMKALLQSLKQLEKGQEYYLSITKMHWYDTVILSKYPCRFYKKSFTNSEMERNVLTAVMSFRQPNVESTFTVAINCVHLESSPSPMYRIEQLQEIQLLNKDMDMTIIAGDFNFSDEGEENAAISHYCDLWKTGNKHFSKWATEEMKTSGFTMPANPHSPALRLDHIIFKTKANQQTKNNEIAIIGDFTIPPYEKDHFSKVSEDFYVRTPSDHFGLLASIFLP